MIELTAFAGLMPRNTSLIGQIGVNKTPTKNLGSVKIIRATHVPLQKTMRQMADFTGIFVPTV